MIINNCFKFSVLLICISTSFSVRASEQFLKPVLQHPVVKLVRDNPKTSTCLALGGACLWVWNYREKANLAFDLYKAQEDNRKLLGQISKAQKVNKKLFDQINKERIEKLYTFSLKDMERVMNKYNGKEQEYNEAKKELNKAKKELKELKGLG